MLAFIIGAVISFVVCLFLATALARNSMLEEEEQSSHCFGGEEL